MILPIIILSITLNIIFVTPPNEEYTIQEQSQDISEINAALEFWSPYITVDDIQIHYLTIDDPLWYNEGWLFYRNHIKSGYNLFLIDNSNSRRLLWNIAAGWNDPDRQSVIQVRSFPAEPAFYNELTTDALLAHEFGHMFLTLPDQFTCDSPDIMSWPVEAWQLQIIGDCSIQILPWQKSVIYLPLVVY